ncbi:MAG: helix-turn-helix transcriptional regulator [Clostridia bacterium]|nr:helix-turn-helix transcriptional regulator [Clostridia bacterium]
MKFNKYNDNFNIIGTNLKRLRKENKISQEQLSNKISLLGVTLYQSDIFKIEQNQRTVRDFELWAISKVMDVDFNEFFKNVDVKINVISKG